MNEHRTWQGASVAPDRTHHVRGGAPLYEARFGEVLSFHEPGLAAARDGTGAFHIRPDGAPAYGRRFRRTFGFYEGRAAVEDGPGWFHLDAEGRDAYPARWTWCGNFQGHRCAVRDGAAYLHVAPDGTPAYAERWRYAGDFREGLAVVLDGEGFHRFIDVEGRGPIPGRFADLDVFHKGYARARDAGGWFHLRRDGEPAYARRFATIEPFYNGRARCETLEGALVVIDESGREEELRPAPRDRA